ncbi:MAG: hypothetical protein HY534_03045 [Chloroflexi bacterium]|nr:hypothetical protein [Chloroflexota bacterium]
MQFSLDRLFEVIEARLGQRFGPPVAQILLVLMCFAAAAFFLNVIFTQFVRPVSAAVSATLEGAIAFPTPRDVLGIVIPILFIWFIGYVGNRFFIAPRFRAAELEARAAVADARAAHERTKAFFEERQVYYEETKAELEALLGQVTSVHTEVVALIQNGMATFTEPGDQPVPGTPGSPIGAGE